MAPQHLCWYHSQCKTGQLELQELQQEASIVQHTVEVCVLVQKTVVLCAVSLTCEQGCSALQLGASDQVAAVEICHSTCPGALKAVAATPCVAKHL